MKIKTWLLPLLLLTSLPSWGLDKYNTYLWNRDNALSGSGQVDRGDWYEWWYFKVVDPQAQEGFYFAYGVVNPWDEQKTLAGTKAVVQAGDFNAHILVHQDFPVNEFSARYDRTFVKAGKNEATDRHLRGDILDANGHHIIWDIALEPDWNFNAMGWSIRAPGSGIYWYPAQASAHATGWIKVDDRTFHFKSAPAYQDRNWGRSFPKWWTWITSNHFAHSPGSALAIGGGEPPLFGENFIWSGLCIGLRHKGREYIFRSTDAFNRVNFDIKWGKWSVQAENRLGEYIQVEAHAPPEKFMDLTFQTPRGPVFHDYEAVLGDVTVKLYKWSSPRGEWILLADLHSKQAGIEWGSPNPVSPNAREFHFSNGTSLDKNGYFEPSGL